MHHDNACINSNGTVGQRNGEHLKHRFPDAHFIIVSNFDDDWFRQKAKMIGAKGYVVKENLEALVDIVFCFENNQP